MIERHMCRLSPEMTHKCSICHKPVRDGFYLAANSIPRITGSEMIWLCSSECGEVAEALEALRA